MQLSFTGRPTRNPIEVRSHCRTTYYSDIFDVHANTAASGDDETDMRKIRLHLREAASLALVGCSRCKGRLRL